MEHASSGRRRRGAIRGRHDQYQAAQQGHSSHSRRVATRPGQYDPGAQLRVGADRRQVPPPRSSALSSILLYGGVALLALGVGAATFFIMSPPSDYIRREIIARVKAETGRDLTIAGGTSFTIFPSLGLRLSDVSLSAPPSMGGEPLVKAANFDVGVRLLPLLRQEIVVDRLELNEPMFSLRVDAEGRKSWDMAGIDLAGALRAGFATASVSAISSSSRRRSRVARGRRAVARRHPHHQRRRALQRRAQWRLGPLRGHQRALLSPRHARAAHRQRHRHGRGRAVRLQEHADDAAGSRRAAPGKAGADRYGRAAQLQLRRHGRPQRRRGHDYRQLVVARRFGALVGQRSVAGSRRGRSRFLGQAECHAKERASLQHRSEGGAHDRQRHGRASRSAKARGRTLPPTSRSPA